MTMTILGEWVRELGFEPGDAVDEDGILLPIRDPLTGRSAGFSIRLRAHPAPEGGPWYAVAGGWGLSYRPDPGPTADPARRVAMLALLDGIRDRLVARHASGGGADEPEARGRGVGATGVIERGRGRNAEHLLRIDFHCNQACPFCFVQLGGRRVRPDEVAALLPPAPDGRAGERVVLTGGEPTLHPDLPGIVARLGALGVGDIGLQTNAVRLADAAYCRRLVEAGVRFAMVSFHAHRPEAYDRVTGSRGQFPAAVAGLRNLWDSGALVAVNIALTRISVAALDAHVRMLATVLDPGDTPRRAVVFFTLLNEFGHLKAPDLAPDPVSIRKALDLAVPLCKALGLNVDPFFGDCSPPPCYLTDPSPVAPRQADPVADVCYLAPGETIPPDRRVKAASCRACRFDVACRGVPSAHARMFGLDALRPM